MLDQLGDMLCEGPNHGIIRHIRNISMHSRVVLQPFLHRLSHELFVHTRGQLCEPSGTQDARFFHVAIMFCAADTIRNTPSANPVREWRHA